MVTNYSGEGTSSSFASTGLRTTISNYDMYYHTYLESTEDGAGHTTSITFDYRMSAPLSMTDNNSQKTYATYDTFGRLLSICRPDDYDTGTPDVCNSSADLIPPITQTNPTNFVSYHEDTNLFWTEATQKLDQQTYYKMYKFYNGMGQLIQTQSLATLKDGVCSTPTDAILWWIMSMILTEG
jgi:YD repeat-containing protein